MERRLWLECLERSWVRKLHKVLKTFRASSGRALGKVLPHIDGGLDYGSGRGKGGERKREKCKAF